MKISLNWLNDYIDIGYDAEAIADILSDKGFPCEEILAHDQDTMIDVEVTSNRGDCLGHLGVARELAAATGKSLKRPEVTLEFNSQDVSSLVEVVVEAPDACARYTARVIQGVTVGPSPDWLVKRLETIGLRTVNNVVDATNYAMMETGQPAHAFDYDKIDQGKIIVRQARAGETLISIDGTPCKLTENMLIIADAKGPVAMAGVMGGLETEVTGQTTTVLLEDAHFEPVTVRTTSRQLALPSDAAYRFERIVDREAMDWISQRTAQLIVQVAGGTVAQGMVDCYPRPRAEAPVILRLSRLAHVLGIDVPPQEVVDILIALGFEPCLQTPEVVTCKVPSWRSDVTREVDLIEEVARCYGYDKVPTQDRIEIQVTSVDAYQKDVQAVARALNACGYYETISVDFVDDATAELFAVREDKNHLAVADVSRKSANKLRQTVMGSLLSILKTNVNVKNLPCRVFEVAHTFVPDASGILPKEETSIGLVADSDFRSLRTAVEQTIRTLVPDAGIEFVPADLPWAQAGAEVRANGVGVGYAGVFSDSVLKAFELKHVMPVGAELAFETLVNMKSDRMTLKAIPRFPAIERDLSLIVAESVKWSDIVAAIDSHGPKELEGVKYREIYRGKGVPKGKKSITLSLRFRDADGTLKHDTVDVFQKPIVAGLVEDVKAELRSA
ncbi:MAG: phenylalanine--tRNA ligase subunit beta [Phycisphaeraceae bacterium]|nr:phenylalanine--tRNA ligase subunit beta [Phycisphaeraceae bacterium]